MQTRPSAARHGAAHAVYCRTDMAKGSTDCFRTDMSRGSIGSLEKTSPMTAQAAVGKTRLGSTVCCTDTSRATQADVDQIFPDKDRLLYMTYTSGVVKAAAQAAVGQRRPRQHARHV
jgi:hypothetical protein